MGVAALALFVVAGSSLIERLPLAALVGVIFMVVKGVLMVTHLLRQDAVYFYPTTLRPLTSP